MDKMQAAVLMAPREVGIVECDLPIPGTGEVRVALEGCGVCASGLPVWEGRPWFRYPLPPGRPGHEGFGRIDAMGPGVERLHPGQRVALLSDAAYATHDVATERSVLVLPPELDGIPFPGESFACGMNIYRRTDVRAGHVVAVIGVGFLGAIQVRLASRAGARVIAISRRPWSLDLARRLGAAEIVPLESREEVVQRVGELTGGRLCDRVVEAVGAQETLTLGGELAAVRGRLVVAGYHQEGTRQVDVKLWNWRGLDVINAHEREPARYLEGMREAVVAIRAGILDPALLLTDRFPLARLSDAFETLAARPSGSLKSWVDLRESE